MRFLPIKWNDLEGRAKFIMDAENCSYDDALTILSDIGWEQWRKNLRQRLKQNHDWEDFEQFLMGKNYICPSCQTMKCNAASWDRRKGICVSCLRSKLPRVISEGEQASALKRSSGHCEHCCGPLNGPGEMFRIFDQVIVTCKSCQASITQNFNNVYKELSIDSEITIPNPTEKFKLPHIPPTGRGRNRSKKTKKQRYRERKKLEKRIAERIAREKRQQQQR